MSTTQESIFAASEADAWFKRNLAAVLKKDPQQDPLFSFLQPEYQRLKIRSYLEVGCSNGFRLAWLKSLGLSVAGFDPSREAIRDGKERYGLRENEIFVPEGLADVWRSSELEMKLGRKVDCIAFAHCLYLIPPSQYPSLVATAVRMLNDGGVILIYDFDSQPQRQKYHHVDQGVWSYKMQFDRLFTGLPYMKLIHKSVNEHGGGPSLGNPKEDCALIAIRKCEVDLGFPQLR